MRFPDGAPVGESADNVDDPGANAGANAGADVGADVDMEMVDGLDN
jgi:hypothetical protein